MTNAANYKRVERRAGDAPTINQFNPMNALERWREQNIALTRLSRHM